jgi:hypothetical protein
MTLPEPARLAHLPRDDRGFPILATIDRTEKTVNFRSISEPRKLALATFDWCAICGLPFGDELRWQVGLTPLPDTETAMSEGPVHELCALYAGLQCPFLAHANARLRLGERAGLTRGDAVFYAAYRSTRNLVVVSAGDEAFGFQHGPAVQRFEATGRPELLVRYEQALGGEQPLAVTAHEQRLVTRFNSRVVVDAFQVIFAALLLGGVSVPGCASALDLPEATLRSALAQTTGLLTSADLRDRMRADPAMAMDDALGWLAEREAESTVPPLLASWRAGLVQRLPQARTAPVGPGRSVSKNAPCPCGSGRKAARCHPAGVPPTDSPGALPAE